MRFSVSYVCLWFVIFLNQVCAGQRPVHNWFLEIAFVHNVGNYVCVPLRVFTQMDPVQLVEQVLIIFNKLTWQFYIYKIDNNDGCDLS